MKTHLLIGLVAATCAAALTLAGCPEQGIVCTEGLTACDGKSCEDLQSDKRNCGACGHACQIGEVCSAGSCICAPGATECNGACVVTDSDPQHCGSCGNACGPAQVCEFGVCQSTCTAGRTQCGQSCVDLEHDANHCGTCDSVCEQGQSCHMGVCAWDVVAACFTNGQVRGLQDGTFVTGPLQQFGTAPQALAVFGRELLLSADGLDNRLYQGRLGDLAKLPVQNALGASPNHVLVDGEYVYALSSAAGSLAIFHAEGQAPADGGSSLDAGTGADAGSASDAGSDLDAGSAADAGSEFDAGSDADAGTDLDGGEAPDAGGDGADAGLWAGGELLDVPAQFPAGVKLTLVKEVQFGENTWPQVMTQVGTHLYVTLYGGFSAATLGAGQKVADVDVSDPAQATFTTIDLSTLPLQPFQPGGESIPRPQGIAERNGVLYVALNHLDSSYNVAGPAYLATVPLDGGAPGLVELPADECLNAGWVKTTPRGVLVTCQGKTDYSQFPKVITTQSGLALVDENDAVVAAVTVGCPEGDDGCASPSLGRFDVVGDTVYAADQSAGRLYVFQLGDGTLTDVRTGATEPGPLNVCPVEEATGYSNVGDVLSVP
ncbi:MAG: hypothetical protein IRZ16_21540 [Myxococcaceae bacterium]|nr:hypothetical protein [Myxococcaceae bacterium]